MTANSPEIKITAQNERLNQPGHVCNTQTDRRTDGQTDRPSGRQTDRQKDGERDRRTESQTERERERETFGQSQTDRQKDGETDGERDRQTERQTNRETDGQRRTDRETNLAPHQHGAEDDLEAVEEVVPYDDDGGAPGGPALTGTDGLDTGGCCWEDSQGSVHATSNVNLCL